MQGVPQVCSGGTWPGLGGFCCPGCSTAVRACPLIPCYLLHSSSPGNVSITSPLFLPQVFLMLFVVYFVVSECLAIKKEGRAYFTLWGNYSQWLFILLTTCTVLVHLSQATLADQQWLRYLSNRRGFTNFYQVAFLSSVFSSLAASLLFLLTVQVQRAGGAAHGCWVLWPCCVCHPCTALPGEGVAGRPPVALLGTLGL